MLVVSPGFVSISARASETNSDALATPVGIDMDSDSDTAPQPAEADEHIATPKEELDPVNQENPDEATSRRDAGAGVFAIAESTVSVSVEMSDGGLVPGGLKASLLPTDSWDAIEIVDISPGSTTANVTFVTKVAHGQYQVWITGSGYSSGQALIVDADTENHDFLLQRLYGSLSVTLTTSDGGAVPAGTQFNLIDSQNQIVQTVVADTTLSNGSVLPLPMSLEFGTYQLSLLAGEFVDGRQAVPQTLTINMTDPWVTDYEINADIEILEVMSTVGLSVEMLDGGSIPMGLEWSLFAPDSWDAIASGPVTSGDILFEHVIPVEVPTGVYQLWITGSGYSSGQVINVQSETFNHGFTLQRLQGDLTITVSTSDGSNVPAGTNWEILDAGNIVVQSGTLTEPLPSGSELEINNPFDFGIYTLNMGTDGDALTSLSFDSLPRELLPHTSIINITNPWFTDFTADVELQWAQSNVTFSVTMTDGNPLPNGLEWTLFLGGNWEPLASGQVTAGEMSFAGEVPYPVPFGVYQLWITGNGYSTGQVLNIESLEMHHVFSLDRLSADVIITLDTSDDAEIPAGTTWSIVDSAGSTVQDGELTAALADGDMLPVSNPFAFDIYTMVIDADGYHPVSIELPITDPWLSDMAFTVNLVSDRLPMPTPTATVPSPQPTVPVTPGPSTPIPATPDPSTPVPPPGTPIPSRDSTVTPEAIVTGLPQTGAYEGSRGMEMVMVLLTGIILATVVGLLVRRRYRIIG